MTDNKKPDKEILAQTAIEITEVETFDLLMAKWKWLAKWERPKYSLAMIGFICTVYWYLKYFSESTPISSAIWVLLICYIAVILIQRLSPEISVEKKIDSSEKSTMGPEQTGGSMSEVSMMIVETGNWFTALQNLRSDAHEVFCILMSSVFMLVGYIGMSIDVVSSVVSLMLFSLISPLALRLIKVNFPRFIEWVMNSGREWTEYMQCHSGNGVDLNRMGKKIIIFAHNLLCRKCQDSKRFRDHRNSEPAEKQDTGNQNKEIDETPLTTEG